MMIICPSCQQQNPLGANYCAYCGTRLEKPQQPQVPEVEQTRFGFNWRAFFISILLSALVTFILSVVFHVPMFVAGLFLPLTFATIKKKSF